MRDVRGRYLNSVPVAESVPAWASGCDQCSCGIVSAPELTGVANLYMERMVQAKDGTLTFCSCQAGQRYRVALLNRYQYLIEEARRHPSMQEAARQLTHPDIANTRAAMHAAYEAAPPPTVHAATHAPAPAQPAPREEVR